MTDPHASRLREIADKLRAIADKLADAVQDAVDADRRDDLVSLTDAAVLAGVRYDTIRMRAQRSGALVKFGGARFVWRSWIELQLFADRTKSVRSVRSL